MTGTSGALAGVRVLDFTRVLAGPFCAMLLADLGADVIKVEDTRTGDDTRTWGPPWLETEAGAFSAYYLSVNRNKRAIALDLKHPDSQRIARDLAVGSAIVLENFRVGGMASFGLGYDDLAARNPALVVASITGYGQTGLYADRPGYDFVIQAMSGYLSITGEPDGAPTKIGVAVTDVIAGLFAAASVLAALRHAERTGVGQHLDVSLFDTALASLVNIASAALISGETPARLGSAHPNIVPYQPFTAADGLFALAVGNDRQFARTCAIVGHPDWADDPRFTTNPARVANRDALVDALNAAFAAHPAATWVDQLLAAGIPAGPINTVTDALHDPHTTARGLLHTIDLFGAALPLVGAPVGMSATPPSVRTPPPAHGQHTDAILRERLNMDDTAIAALHASGAVK